MNYLKLIWA